ncbi:MAG: alpha-2-macroglobulin family protein, partial [Ilumatobacteraceae bacterium]
PDGQPVAGADVAIVVVDEAVLSLTGYQLPDPLDVFYAPIWSTLTSQYLRSTIELTRPDLISGGDTADGGLAATDSMSDEMTDAAAPAAQESSRSAGPPIDVRSNFDALALYAPGQTTSADGTVTVDVPVPDGLTRYRVMAVAVDGAERFGTGDATITARLPLQVRPSAPRFLNYGDHFQLPVVVQNQTDVAIDVDIALEVSNLVLEGPAGQRVTVPANDRVEVRFPVTTDQVGTARFRVAGISGDLADAAAIALPVYTPATTEAFATYGVVDDDGGVIGQPIVAPTDVFAQFGGLEFDTSATALQSLTDAVLYLVDYDYDSSDGLASRIMAIAGLRDVLSAFDAEGLPDADSLERTVNTDLSRLVSLQNDDGGFPFWQRGRQSVPWQSIQSTHALVLARLAGYSVPTVPLQRALDHLASIEEYFPVEYGESVRNSLSAYALYVRSLAGQPDAPKATALYLRVGDDLELDAVAWLWPSIADAALREQISTRFRNSAVETAGAVTFATGYDEDAYVIAASDRKTDGIILDALITQDPDSDLIPKTVAGLLGNQVRGRWNNAQENAFILLALDRYFDTFESVEPDFVARMWLGDLYASEHQFIGRTTDRDSTLVPMIEVVAAGDTSLVVAKDGVGRLYYRLGLRYAPTDLTLDPRDEGFVVDRNYEAVDDPADVRQDPDGTWHIRAGATVRVRVTMAADARRTNVALVDPLPAGFEPVNPALETSPPIVPDEPGDDTVRPWYRAFSWFDHQNLRDDRAEAFTSLLSGGTYEYTYVARATTPGTFVAPPARAEEMYAPEVFGRSASAVVVVE